MRKLVLALLLLAPSIAQGQTFTFPTTQNPISQGGTWTSGGAAGSNCSPFTGQCWNDVQIINAIAANTGTNSGCTGSPGSNCNDATAALTGSWASNEQACGVVSLGSGLNRGSTDEMEIRLNVTISTQSITGYEFTYSTKASPNQYSGFARWNGAVGNFTIIGTSGTTPALTSGDTICASNVGGTLIGWLIHSGVKTIVANATDTTFTGGSPGMGFYNQGTPSDNGQYGFSSFTVSNPSGSVPTVSPTSENFGSVAVGSTSGSQTATVTNNSGLTITFTSSTYSSTGTSTGTNFLTTGSPTCTGTLANGGTCTIATAFRPSITGSLNDTLNIAFTGTTGSPLQVALSGTGSGGGGSTFTAISANETDVNAVINGPTHVAANGDTIQIPCSGSQTVTWTSTLSITASIKITALGGTPNSGPGSFGSGTNCLTILDNNTSGTLFSFNPTFASSNNVSTLENINIDPITATTNFLWSPVFFNGTCTASGCPLVRTDNMFFGKSAQWTEGSNCAFPAPTECNWLIRANNVFGVIDHVTTPTGTKVDLLSGGLDSYLGVGGFGDNSWATPDTFGTQSALYIENSVLTTNQEFTDCEKSPSGGVGGGCRLVGRFNHLASDPNQLFIAFGVHGLDTGGRTRGGRQIEAYGNTLNCLAVNGCSGGIVSYRGGTGFAFNNTLTGHNYNTIGNITVYRTVYAASPLPWFACGGLNSKDPWDTNDNVVYFSGTVTSGGGTTATDSTKNFTTNQFIPNGAPYTFYDVTQQFMAEINANTSTTLSLNGPISEQNWSVNIGDSYQIIRATVCADQGGRGQGILVSGSSPSPVSALNEALDPVYVWNNPAPSTSFGNFGPTDTNRVIANRDYYVDTNTATPLGPQTSPTSPFNGTGAGGLGVGFGTLANRPPCASGCVIGVGYFATDQGNWNNGCGTGQQGILYTLTAPSTWTVHYTPFTCPHPLTVGGGGGTPAIGFSPASLAFGNVLVGSTSPSSTVMLSNTGSAQLAISGITLTGTNPSDFGQSNNCGTAVNVGGSCAITATCTPLSAASFSANISVADNVAGSPQTVPLTCTGVTATPGIRFTPTTVAFSGQTVGTSSAPTAVTVTNTGSATLTVAGIVVSGGNQTSFTQTNNCTSVAPSGTCTINVTFTPQIAGSLASSVCVTDNAALSPQCFAVSGTGNGVAGIAFNPTGLVFGNQAVSVTSSPLTVTVSNPGTAATTLSLIALTGTNAADFAISANTCPGSLAVNATCTVSVTFTPGVTGSRVANLTFTDNAPASPQNVALSGTGTQAGTSFSPTSLAFGNQNANTTSAPLTTTLTNTGSATLNITSIAITGAQASNFAISSKTCGTTLVASSTCTVSVTFTPSGPGAISASLSFADNAPASPQSVPLTGTGIANALSVSPSSLSFPATVVGQLSPSQSVTVTNPNSIAITFTTIAISGGNAADFSQTNTCGASLAAQSSCNVAVTFKPAATGARSSSLVLTDSAPNSPQSVTLSGTGTQSGALVSPTTISFPNTPVGTTSPAQGVTLTNNGTATLNISSIALRPGDTYFSISSNTCGTTLAVNAACTVSLTFTPQTAGSGFTCVLSFTDDGPGSPQTVNGSGTGTTLALSFNPTSLAFGSVNVGTTSPTQTFTMTNNGNGVTTISGITIIGTNLGDFSQTNTCGSSLGGGASCTFSVNFLPTAGGARSASVQITDNAPGSPQTVALSGTGVTPTAGISLSPTSLTFASQTVGTSSASQPITVSNPGSGNLIISSVAVSGDYSQTNNCTTVAPAGTCTVNVTFTPTTTGTRAGVLTLSDNAAGSPHTAPLTGVGTGIPNINLNPTSIAFPNTTVTTTSSALSTVVTNNGTATLTLSSITLTGTNAAMFTISGNTCGGSLGVGLNCTVSVTFSPTSTGAKSAALTFADNAAGSPQSVPLSGTGTQAATSFSPTSLAFGSIAVSTTSAALSTRLTNTGTATLNIASITLTGTNLGDFLISSNTCGTTVAPSAFCDVGVTFSPTTTGARSANLSFADSAPASPQTVALTGTGTAPAISFAPTSLSFGQVTVGNSSQLSTTLTNTGGAPLLISGISITGVNLTSFSQTNTCGASVGAGANCTITVTFNPQATGSLTASVSVSDNATGSPHTVTLQGTGTQGIAVLAPTSLGFGNQTVATTSAPLTTTLTNNGTATFTISSIALSGSSYFTISANTCGATLAPSASCAISVTFTPAITGAASGTIMVTDNAPGSPQSVALTGTGTGTAFVSFVPASLTFPNTAVSTASAALTTTLKNTGTANLTGVSISITGTNASNFAQTNNCGTSVLAGGSCTINVTFTPSANGVRTANVQVVDSIGTQTVPLQGTGFTPAPAVSLSVSSINFGDQTVSTQSNPHTVVLTNTGTATLTVSAATKTGANPGDYSVSTTCGASLAINATCSYSIVFIPTGAGSRTATLNVNTNSASSPDLVSLTGNGVVGQQGVPSPQVFGDD